jgi:hypothetical protein
MNGNSLSTPGEESEQRPKRLSRRGMNETCDKNFPSTKGQRPSLRADERIEVRATPCPWNVKLSLQMNKPHISQRQEDLERKWEYCQINYFP